MMRCYICDYSDNTEKNSLLHFSLVDPKGTRKRRVRLDERGKEVCDYCEGERKHE